MEMSGAWEEPPPRFQAFLDSCLSWWITSLPKCGFDSSGYWRVTSAARSIARSIRRSQFNVILRFEHALGIGVEARSFSHQGSNVSARIMGRE